MLFFGVISDTEEANGKIAYNMKSIDDQIKQVENALKGYIELIGGYFGEEVAKTIKRI